MDKLLQQLIFFNKTAYLSDCSNINPSDLNKLKKLNYLIIDCLKFKRHPGHFNLETSIRIIDFFKAQKNNFNKPSYRTRL